MGVRLVADLRALWVVGHGTAGGVMRSMVACV